MIDLTDHIGEYFKISSRLLVLIIQVDTKDFIKKCLRYKKKKIPNSLRMEVFRRDGFICFKCGDKNANHIDHIYPERYGRETIKSNLRVLCKSCNSKKGSKIETNNKKNG